MRTLNLWNVINVNAISTVIRTGLSSVMSKMKNNTDQKSTVQGQSKADLEQDENQEPLSGVWRQIRAALVGKAIVRKSKDHGL